MENKTISQETEPFHWFTQRLGAYGADLEHAKFIVDSFIEKSTDGGKFFDLFKVAKEKYPYVSRHNNSKKQRRNVGHHLRGTLHVAFVKELYEDFVEYISSILKCSAHAGIQPERFVGTSTVNVSIVEMLKNSVLGILWSRICPTGSFGPLRISAILKNSSRAWTKDLV